jgi:hypothetical protein
MSQKASTQETREAVLKFLKNDAVPVICWLHDTTSCGYKCCYCWDTGNAYDRNGDKGECSCIDAGIWEIDNPEKWEDVK